jgi:hypothetical protein
MHFQTVTTSCEHTRFYVCLYRHLHRMSRPDIGLSKGSNMLRESQKLSRPVPIAFPVYPVFTFQPLAMDHSNVSSNFPPQTNFKL